MALLVLGVAIRLDPRPASPLISARFANRDIPADLGLQRRI
jgi:hypothetical protein